MGNKSSTEHTQPHTHTLTLTHTQLLTAQWWPVRLFALSKLKWTSTEWAQEKVKKNKNVITKIKINQLQVDLFFFLLIVLSIVRSIAS